jgi:hypothetical protein
MEDTIPYQFDKAKFELILSSGMIDNNSDNKAKPQKKLAKFIIDLIMSAIRLDIAICTKNQQFECMMEVEKFLLKQLTVDNLRMDSMRQTMEYEQMIVDIPDDKRWQSSLKIFTDHTSKENEIVSPLIPLSTHEAWLGFERLQKATEKELATRKTQTLKSKPVSTTSMEHAAEDEKVRIDLQQTLIGVNISLSETASGIDEISGHLISNNGISTMGDRGRKYDSSHHAAEVNGESYVSDVGLSTYQHDKYSKKAYHHESKSEPPYDVNLEPTPIVANLINEKTARYHPDISKQAVTTDIDDVILSSNDWDAVIIGFKSTLDVSLQNISVDQTEEERILHLKSNDGPTLSGRIGECIAFVKLQHMYPGLSVNWVNKDEETGLTYDIVLSVEALDKAADIDNVYRAKYCEVKTRLLENDNGSHSMSPLQSRKQRRDIRQWFISSKEIVEAEKRGDQYFCILISLEKLKTNSIVEDVRMCVRSIQIVGYENGLSMALKTHQASLIVQTNSEINMEYAEDDEC